MKINPIKKNKVLNKGGFTLIETMVAVFILTLTLASLLTIVANSIFDSRYARNEIIANYLLQEAVDSIRNNRDTIAFQHYDDGSGNGPGTWNIFLNKYGYNNGSSSGTCFVDSLTTSTAGCYIDPVDASKIPLPCSVSGDFGDSECPVLSFDSNATNNNFYTYAVKDTSGNSLPKSNFKRQIVMKMSDTNTDELDVRVTLEWLNGGLLRSRSLQLSLLNWQN